MTLTAASANLRLFATVTPADPLASGNYEIGSAPARYSFPDADQVYSVKVTGQDGVSNFNIQSGVLTPAAGATATGGGGKDPDGADIDLGELYAVRIINTGSVDLGIEVENWTGAAARMIETAAVAPGGELVVVDPGGAAILLCSIDITTAAGGSWDAVVLGKIAV